MKKTFFTLPAVFLCLRAACAVDSEISVTPSGSVYYQAGQLVHTTLSANDAWPDKTWDQRAVLRAQLNAQIKEHLQINVGIEFGMIMQAKPPVNGSGVGSSATYNIFDPLIAQGVYSFGDDPLHPPLQIALGYFPFKYDASANNMGEYLFRTGTYPPFIINTFNECQARLLGLRVSVSPIENLNLDMLFTNEMFYYPLGDYSLSFLAGYKFAKVLNIGAGISFKDLISVDPSQTTPHSTPIYQDASGAILMNGNDTAFYTFKATKLMGRVSFDPKGPFDSPTFFGMPFGTNDCKLYCESAILGLKNYGGFPGYFSNLADRWPIMVGFNIPTFNIFNVLSFEYEYTHVKYDKFTFNNTIPVDNNTSSDSLAGDAGSRWSLYVNKFLKNGIGFSGLVGKDHFRPTPTTTTSPPSGIDNPSPGYPYGSEMLIGNGDWHYALRITYSF